MAQWKIAGRQAACCVCDRAFEDGERHHSMVQILGDALRRLDGCLTCWDKGEFGPDQELPSPGFPGAEGPSSEVSASTEKSDASADSTAKGQAADPNAASEDGAEAIAEVAMGAHRFWWTTRHQAAPQKTLTMDMDALQRLFLELDKREERNLKELRYVLCLLLMRKKRVKLERILREDTRESFIVRRPRTEERYTVEVFDFTPERMGEVREHLQAIFDGLDGDEALAQAASGEPVDRAEEEPIGDDPVGASTEN